MAQNNDLCSVPLKAPSLSSDREIVFYTEDKGPVSDLTLSKVSAVAPDFQLGKSKPDIGLLMHTVGTFPSAATRGLI